MPSKTSSRIPLYKDPSKPVERRVNDLLRRMTVEEKAEQLQQETIGRDVNPNNVGESQSFNPRIGSVLSFWHESKARNAFQRIAVEQTRLGIPIIWGCDIIHGHRTIFPVPLAQACSFRPELTERASRVSALEAWHDMGIDWTFSPMVEVCHDPRWGRVVEGYGEDPYTARRFTRAAVHGYQGRKASDLTKPGYIASCLKHYVGYSASEGGRDYTYTDISRRALWDWHMQPFEEGVAAGARTLMSSFNAITGVPAVANHYTLTEVLRERWGFTGLVVSDWNGIAQQKDMRCASDKGQQALNALLAGNDMDMVSGVYKEIPRLVSEGRLKMKDLDRAVARVLRVKFELGLFEHPYAPEAEDVHDVCLLPEYRKCAVEVARETMVLLKNEDATLPLDATKKQTIALIGPAIDSNLVHLGSWPGAASYNSEYAPTYLDRIAEVFPNAKILHAGGCHFKDDSTDGFPAAVRTAKKADVVILAVGEAGDQSGEYRSRSDIRLPGVQSQLAEAIARTGKPIVSLVTAGRPLVFPELLELSQAVLYVWQGGCGGAQAAFEILAGKVNPSGKLAMTFPRCVGQIPIYYNDYPRVRSWAIDYTDLPDGPMFPFGYGLSYTTFEYGKISVFEKCPGRLAATVEVTNTGDRAGDETVLWFLTDLEATLSPARQRVIGFEKISLSSGESKVVELSFGRKDLSYRDEEGRFVFEAGDFTLVASNRKDTLATFHCNEKGRLTDGRN